MGMRWTSKLVEVLPWLSFSLALASGIGVNWGTRLSHPLPPETVAHMLRDNGFQKVKLFDADKAALSALAKTGIEVMVGIPNDMLGVLASGHKAAQNWVAKNVSRYIDDGVQIKYVSVGNEPFLQTFNGSFLQTTLPALQNIQAALIAAGLSSQVKVTIPLNADVYETSNDKPSGGDFRLDIRDLMVSFVKFLNDNNGSFTVNIYPFISLYDDPNFPVDYAFFQGTSAPVVDGSITYANMFDANHDTLVAALQKIGYGNMSIIVGEIGWPTDGDANANPQFAQQFNQGLMDHISSGIGTPLRPGPIDAYLFSLIDEDEKSIQPGNFERHWGIFAYDGIAKYKLNLHTANSSTGLVQVESVKYLEKKWCVLKPSVSLDDQQVAASVSYACANADCTSLGYKTSCGNLDTRGNISYAFNSYYQKNDQDYRACKFSGLATVTKEDPSTGTCKFGIMIDYVGAGESWRLRTLGAKVGLFLYGFLPVMLSLL